jgi:hypothetical protein
MEKQIFLSRHFARRRNADASVDSICLACFMTVGTTLRELALQDLESNHHCEAWVAERLPLFPQPGSSLSISEGPGQSAAIASKP